MGVPSAETVRQRAMELALIEGRSIYTDEDWKRAFHELHGGHHENGENGHRAADDEMIEAISERDMVAPTLGHHHNNEVEGGASLGEELVAEGLDEAVHEQMLESRRLDRDHDAEDEVAE